MAKISGLLNCSALYRVYANISAECFSNSGSLGTIAGIAGFNIMGPLSNQSFVELQVSPQYRWDNQQYLNQDIKIIFSNYETFAAGNRFFSMFPSETQRFKLASWSYPYPYPISRLDGLPDDCSRCSDDSCRVDCAASPHGFCCIDHALTNAIASLLS